MSLGLIIIAGIFLPLFPLSMVFNTLFDRARNTKLRILILLVWPQIGLLIAHSAGVDIPTWVLVWAGLTALLYGFRALVLREVSMWVSFIATSSWAVLWAVMDGNATSGEMIYFALGFSIPLAILVLLASELEKRFGAAYTGLYNGIAETLPRLSGVLSMVVLAIIATPLFPAFSGMLAGIVNAASASFFAASLLSLVWLIWGWAGARLLQGLLIGEPKESVVAEDLGCGRAWGYGLLLTGLVIVGINMIGGLA